MSGFGGMLSFELKDNDSIASPLKQPIIWRTYVTEISRVDYDLDSIVFIRKSSQSFLSIVSGTIININDLFFWDMINKNDSIPYGPKSVFRICIFYFLNRFSGVKQRPLS